MESTEIQPTPTQIKSGYLVVPQRFVTANDWAIDWRTDFTAEAFGDTLPARKLDQCNRLRVKLQDVIAPGQRLRVSVKDGKLVVEVLEKGVTSLGT
jgi:hypothetical protein